MREFETTRDPLAELEALMQRYRYVALARAGRCALRRRRRGFPRLRHGALLRADRAAVAAGRSRAAGEPLHHHRHAAHLRSPHPPAAHRGECASSTATSMPPISAPRTRSRAIIAKLNEPARLPMLPITAAPQVPTPTGNTTREEYMKMVTRRPGVHPRRRHLSVRAVAAFRDRLHRRPAHALPRAALRESVALHVLHEVRRPLRARRQQPGGPRPRDQRADRNPPHRRHAQTRQRPTRKTRPTPPSCSPIRRNAPSTSCSSISRATTSAAPASSAA